QLLSVGSELTIDRVHEQLANGSVLQGSVDGSPIELTHELTPRQRELLRVGGVINRISEGGA
ncbi:MAG: hypothetical protein KGY57_03810, partial [Gammaproteobacteria bacterium]|nr:hypothetical protein [Gammaproteobacteria bacterium]